MGYFHIFSIFHVQTDAKIRRISKYLKERQEMSDLRNDTIVGCNIDKDSLQFGPFYGGNTGKYQYVSL